MGIVASTIHASRLLKCNITIVNAVSWTTAIAVGAAGSNCYPITYHHYCLQLGTDVVATVTVSKLVTVAAADAILAPTVLLTHQQRTTAAIAASIIACHRWYTSDK